MQKIQVSIEFEDGSTEELILRPKSIIAAERKFGGTLPPIEGGMFAAFFQLGMPGGSKNFDEWLDSIVAFDDEIMDPTEASSDEESPGSQSSRGSRRASSKT